MIKKIRKIYRRLKKIDNFERLNKKQISWAFGCSETTAFLFLELATKFGYYQKVLYSRCHEHRGRTLEQIPYTNTLNDKKNCCWCDEIVKVENLVGYIQNK